MRQEAIVLGFVGRRKHDAAFERVGAQVQAHGTERVVEALRSSDDRVKLVDAVHGQKRHEEGLGDHDARVTQEGRVETAGLRDADDAFQAVKAAIARFTNGRVHRG